MLACSPSTGDLEKMVYPYFFPPKPQTNILPDFTPESPGPNSNLGTTGGLELQEFGNCYNFPLAFIEEIEKGTGIIHSPCQSPRATHSPMAGLDLKESERTLYISRISAWEAWIPFSTVAARQCHPILSHSP